MRCTQSLACEWTSWKAQSGVKRLPTSKVGRGEQHVIEKSIISSPTISYYLSTSTNFSEIPSGFSRARQLTAPANTLTPSTTAQSQQTWLPPPASATRHTPQPTFSDFSLFEPATTRTQAPQATPRRAPSLDSTLQRSFNTAQAAAFPTQTDNLYSVQTDNYTQRPTRPPVPLFHSNSTGNIASQPNINQQFNVADFDAITMGGGVNVAYEGTFGDLSSNGNFDFDSFMSAHSVADGMLATDFTAFNNGGNANGTTVSPQEVFNDSMPPSTSFTNLTTPGSTFLETPDDDYQTSPLFTDNLDSGNNGYWPPLFDDAEASAAALTGAPMMVRNSSTSSANQIVVHPGGESMIRKRSSTIASPAVLSPVVKHSGIAGVAARKRDKPLPPIVVDENDTVALKRARNTAAARKSRAKKVAERDDLESEISKLKAEVEFWQARAKALGDTTPIKSEE